MYMKALLAVCVVATFALVTSSIAQNNDPMVDSSTFDVFTTEVGTFEFLGNSPRRIWASTRNNKELKEKTNLWQFRYDPLFVFGYKKEDGKLNLEVGPYGSRWFAQFPLLLDDPEARLKAHSEIERRYRAEDGDILLGNILARSLVELKLSLSPLVQGEFPTAKLVRDSWKFPAPQDFLYIQVAFDDEDEAKRFQELTQGSFAVPIIDYEYSANSAISVQNSVSVTIESLRNSELKASLDGLGTTEKYVRRDDVRKLLQNDLARISRQSYVEDPDTFATDFVDTLLIELFEQVRVDLTSFDEEFQKSTYDGDDLSPAKITSQLNKDFTKETGEDSWKASADATYGAFAGKASGERLTKFLKERQIEVDIKGDPARIVPKAITLHRFNEAAFESRTEVFDIRTSVTPRSRRLHSGSVAVINAPGIGSSVPDLSGRVSTLEELLSKPLQTEVIKLEGIQEGETLGVVGREEAKPMRVVVSEAIPGINAAVVTERRVIEQFYVMEGVISGQSGTINTRILDKVIQIQGEGYQLFDIELHPDRGRFYIIGARLAKSKFN